MIFLHLFESIYLIFFQFLTYNLYMQNSAHSSFNTLVVFQQRQQRETLELWDPASSSPSGITCSLVAFHARLCEQASCDTLQINNASKEMATSCFHRKVLLDSSVRTEATFTSPKTCDQQVLIRLQSHLEELTWRIEAQEITLVHVPNGWPRAQPRLPVCLRRIDDH